MEDHNEPLFMEVLISTYGEDGIRRLASGKHPRVDGVRYLVSWQTDGGCPIPNELQRTDFKIIKTDTKGLSINRNNAISHAEAPVLLIGDDDVEYSQEGLLNVVDSFERNRDCDIITFRYVSSYNEKFFPDAPCSLNTPPKGYFVSSIEIAFRKDSVKGKIWFNENFGIGAMFPSGEEDIFLHDCLDRGLKGQFLPLTIARHDDPTTSERNLMLPSRPQTKGAVFMRLHPYSWPLRMIAHALREIPLWMKGITPNPVSYCHNWIKGAAKATKYKVFNTQDSRKRKCQE
ncbi:MAG: glycosyltransferase [Muribaculaceae bacterium]|nr:glycosyltransferase [Muribaculaceae bacterium]